MWILLLIAYAKGYISTFIPNNGNFSVYVAITMVITMVLEEFFFRYFLFFVMDYIFISNYFVIISTVTFSLSYIPQKNIWILFYQIPTTGVLGYYISLDFNENQSLFRAFFIHFIYNFVTVLTMECLRKKDVKEFRPLYLCQRRLSIEDPNPVFKHIKNRALIGEYFRDSRNIQ